MQLKKIKVYGKLRQFLKQSTFEAAVNSPQQAVLFLKANFEGVEKHLNEQIYKVKMGGRIITEDCLSLQGQGDIQIIPVATGSLPAVGFLFTGFAAEVGLFISGLGFIGAGVLGTAISGLMTIVGQSLIIDGISNLLSSGDKSRDQSSVGDTDPRIRGSYSFSGIQNINTTGVPIPILYGHVFSGSIIISAGVDTAQMRNLLAFEGLYLLKRNDQGIMRIIVSINNHGFKNTQTIRLNFRNGPLLNTPNDNKVYEIIENSVTTNEFIVLPKTTISQENFDLNTVNATEAFFDIPNP